jgi:hypothetical protein
MQQRFAKFLTDLQKIYSCSLIVSTHSTTLLSALGQYGGTKTSILYLNNYKERLSAIPFDKFYKKMSLCLGGHALMGPLFNIPILLVEGDDDYTIWSEIPRHGSLNFAVIPCNGDEIYEYQRALENLFESILPDNQNPSGFALLDGDKNSGKGQQNHVKFIKLKCHESENLYLADQVLDALKCNWDKARTKIVSESIKYGEKKTELDKIIEGDRKTVDCKRVINQIAQILDSKNLPWARRLGKVLAKERPRGQLADFLGDDIVKSLWRDDVKKI